MLGFTDIKYAMMTEPDVLDFPSMFLHLQEPDYPLCPGPRVMSASATLMQTLRS